MAPKLLLILGSILVAQTLFGQVGDDGVGESNRKPKSEWRSVLPNEFSFEPKARDLAAEALLKHPERNIEEPVELPAMEVTGEVPGVSMIDLSEKFARETVQEKERVVLSKIGTGMHQIGGERGGLRVLTVFGIPVMAGFGFRW